MSPKGSVVGDVCLTRDRPEIDVLSRDQIALMIENISTR